MTSCLLFCTWIPFRKEVYSKRKEFGSKFFPFREDHISKREVKQFWQNCLPWKCIYFISKLIPSNWNLYVFFLPSCHPYTYTLLLGIDLKLSFWSFKKLYCIYSFSCSWLKFRLWGGINLLLGEMSQMKSHSMCSVDGRCQSISKARTNWWHRAI